MKKKFYVLVCLSLIGCMNNRDWRAYNNSDNHVGGVNVLDPTDDPGSEFYGYDYNPYDYADKGNQDDQTEPSTGNQPGTGGNSTNVCRKINAGSQITSDCTGMDVDPANLKTYGEFCVRDCECKTGYCSSPIPGQGRCAAECGWYYCNNDDKQELKYLDCPMPGTGGCDNTYFDNEIKEWPQAYRQSCLNLGENECDENQHHKLEGTYCIIRSLPKKINVHGKLTCRMGTNYRYWLTCAPDCSYEEIPNNGFDDDCSDVDLSSYDQQP